jgi:xylulokinase
MNQYILAHDLGTSGNKAVLCDENGSILFSCSSTYPTAYPQDGWVEHDPRMWWKAVCDSTHEILSQSNVSAKDIAAVSFSGIMNSCLPVDRDNNALRPAMIWADKRSISQADVIKQQIGLKEAYNITGHRIDPAYVISKILWLKEHEPDVYRKTHLFLQTKDYIVAQLTGEFVTDYSDASHLGCLDIRKKVWSEEILQAVGIDKAKLPVIRTSTDVVGYVTKTASIQTGLPEGLPVVLGGGDGACATAGAGITQVGEGYTNLGTSAWISMVSDTPLFSEQYITFNFINLDGTSYMPIGTMQSAGHSFEWALDQLFSDQERSKKDFYRKVSADVEKTDPAFRLLYLPYLLGERSPWWNSEARGCFIGLNSTSDRYQMVRSVIEGVSFNLKVILDAMEPFLHSRNLTVIGGLARNDAWLSTLSSVLDVNLQVKEYVTEGTSIGALLCGGIGAGIFSDFSQAQKLNPVRVEHKRDERYRNMYDEKYEIFKEAYHSLNGVFDKMKSIVT